MRELAYQTVYNTLKNAILRGEYPVGSFLPVEAELETIFHVSRTTVRKATKQLAEDGYVRIVQGRGTVVLDRKTAQSFTHVTSVTESLRHNGYEVATRKRQIDRFFPGEEIRHALQLTASDSVIRVQRVQTADGIPVCIMTNYIPEKYVPGFAKDDTEFVALYQYLEAQYGLFVHYTDDTIYAEGADFMTALILEKDPGFPLLHIDRICYNEQQEPICMDIVQILGDRYKAQISTAGRQK